MRSSIFKLIKISKIPNLNFKNYLFFIEFIYFDFFSKKKTLIVLHIKIACFNSSNYSLKVSTNKIFKRLY